MKKIYFEDDGQDVLWWLIDDQGIVQACNLQEAIWKGLEVIMTERSANLDDVQPGDHLVFIFKNGKPGTFIHAVEKVKELSAAAACEILNR